MEDVAYRASLPTRVWVWLKAYWYVPVGLVVAVIGLAIYASTGGRLGYELLRVDKKIAQRRQKAQEEISQLEEETERRIRGVEAAHVEQIEAFEDSQKTAYQRVRQRGPDAVAVWLNDFDRRL